jgi:hypothetical protein
VYVGYLVVILEVAARVVFLFPHHHLWSETDALWRRSWYQRHHGRAEIYYPIHTWDSTKGWRTRPDLVRVEHWGLEGVRPMTGKTLTTNAWGFRGTGALAAAKVPGRTRILLLGDSFTFGDEVNDDETYARYLQDRFPNAEVVNAGVSGYAHDQMLVSLSELAPRLHPDLVVLGFLQMDMSRNQLGFRDFAKPRFVIRRDQLELVGSPVPTPEAVLRTAWLQPRLFDVFASLRYKFLVSRGIEQRQTQEITTRLLAEIVAVARRSGARTVFAYLPAGSEISTTAQPTDGEQFFSRTCAAIPAVRCVTTRPEFARRLAAGEVFELQGHWGANGHHAVADAIAGFLVDEGLIDNRH